jgi:hypothetical protein
MDFVGAASAEGGVTQLVRYEAARTALAEAHRIDEVKDIRDKAEAMAAYARQAHDTAMIEMATEIKVRAEIRGGELLKLMGERGERHNGRGNNKSPELASHDVRPTLSDLGVTENESSRWQRLAEIPEPQREAAIESMKKTVGQVTTAGMLRFAKALQETQALKDMLAEARKQAANSMRHPSMWPDLMAAIMVAVKEIEMAGHPPPVPEDIAIRAMAALNRIASFIQQHRKATPHDTTDDRHH